MKLIKSLSRSFSAVKAPLALSTSMGEIGLQGLSSPRAHAESHVPISHGATASAFQVPNIRPGRGLCFSPNGSHFLRYGHSHEVQILSSVDCACICTLICPAANSTARFATFSSDGEHIMVACDGLGEGGALHA